MLANPFLIVMLMTVGMMLKFQCEARPRHRSHRKNRNESPEREIDFDRELREYYSGSGVEEQQEEPRRMKTKMSDEQYGWISSPPIPPDCEKVPSGIFCVDYPSNSPSSDSTFYENKDSLETSTNSYDSDFEDVYNDFEDVYNTAEIKTHRTTAERRRNYNRDEYDLSALAADWDSSTK